MQNEPEPTARASRKQRCLRGGLLLLLLTASFLAWREYTFRAAVREIQEAGFDWFYDDPLEIIRHDWRAVFRADTWSIEKRGILIQGNAWKTIAKHRKAFERLQPVNFSIVNGTGAPRLEVLGAVQSLRSLSVSVCYSLRDLSGLESLKELKQLQLLYCPELENVDAIKGLTGLKTIEIAACPHMTREAISSLESALPHADIAHDFERSFDRGNERL